MTLSQNSRASGCVRPRVLAGCHVTPSRLMPSQWVSAVVAGGPPAMTAPRCGLQKFYCAGAGPARTQAKPMPLYLSMKISPNLTAVPVIPQSK